MSRQYAIITPVPDVRLTSKNCTNKPHHKCNVLKAGRRKFATTRLYQEFLIFFRTDINQKSCSLLLLWCFSLFRESTVISLKRAVYGSQLSVSLSEVHNVSVSIIYILFTSIVGFRKTDSLEFKPLLRLIVSLMQDISDAV